jgi:hypothetical protein
VTPVLLGALLRMTTVDRLRWSTVMKKGQLCKALLPHLGDFGHDVPPGVQQRDGQSSKEAATGEAASLGGLRGHPRATTVLKMLQYQHNHPISSDVMGSNFHGR